MENKTFLHLLLLALGFLLLMVIVVMMLSPILAFLLIAMFGLIFTILWYKWPQLHDVVSDMFRKGRKRIQNATKTEVEEYDVAFHPEYQLVFTRHGRNTKTVIDKERFLIGRKSSCNLVINDPSISGEHCCIVYRQYSHAYYIEDLRSNNGTYLGVRRLEPFTQEKLLDDAEITISDRVYRFRKIS